MRTFNASLFVFAALAFTHAAALPTRYRRQGGSSSVDFICPPKDLDGVSLANSTVDGDILTCLYGKTDCSYAVDVCFLSVDGNQVVEQDGSMMSSAPPPSCALTADPSSGWSSGSGSSESTTDNTLTHSKHPSRCSITKHSIRGQPARNRKLGHKWDSGSGDIPPDQFVSGAPLAGGAVLRDRTLFDVSPFPPFRGAQSVNYWHKVGLNFPEMPEIDGLGFAPFLSIEKNQKDTYLTLVSETASRTENGRACNVTQHEWTVDGCSEFLRRHPKWRIGNEYGREGSLNEERAVISRNDNPLNIVVGTAFNKNWQRWGKVVRFEFRENATNEHMDWNRNCKSRPVAPARISLAGWMDGFTHLRRRRPRTVVVAHFIASDDGASMTWGRVGVNLGGTRGKVEVNLWRSEVGVEVWRSGEPEVKRRGHRTQCKRGGG
ncbi:hypothetical protein K438DRAFT_1766392 [Mycena galopus ATCC 62051]|nr:hypothetical protein K438DRAFT_1766392 [Mycena galopus ATCC 62051]